MVTYLVPNDTQRVVANALDRCLHAGLMLTRYSSQEAIERKATANDRYTLERDSWLKQIVSQVTTNSEELRALVEASYTRWLSMTEGASRFPMIARGRLIVGLGAKGALEMGITLHHTTGLPYIPGSALKGIARSYALLTLAANANIKLDDLERFDADLVRGRFDAEIDGARMYREVFGLAADAKHGIKDSQAGGVIFHDAVLYDVPQNIERGELFTLDVMTPHFPKYYRSSGGDAPHDADSPNPVTFLTANAGLIFAFAVGARSGTSDDVRKQARRWLQEALQELGVGSKTASGYGVFMKPPK